MGAKKEVVAEVVDQATVDQATQEIVAEVVDQATVDQATKEVVAEVVFLNPFDQGVSYKEFLASVPEGVSVREHCELNLEPEQVDWIVNECEAFLSNSNTQETETDNPLI